MKRLVILAITTLATITALAIPNAAIPVVKQATPTGYCGPTYEQCDRWSKSCVGVADSAEAMCYAMGGNRNQCYLIEWHNTYRTCMQGTGCSGVVVPPDN